MIDDRSKATEGVRSGYMIFLSVFDTFRRLECRWRIGIYLSLSGASSHDSVFEKCEVVSLVLRLRVLLT